MRKAMVIFLVLSLPVMIFSQVRLSKEFDVSTSTPYQVVDAPSKNYVSVGDNKVISVKTKGSVVIIQQFDASSMKELSRKEYEDFPKYSKFQDLIQLGDKVFYMFEAYDKATKNFSLYAREVDVNATKFKSSKKLFTTDGPVVNARNQLPIMELGFIGAKAFTLGYKFSFYSSFDQSKLLVQYRYKPTIKSDAKNNDRLGFCVLDNNMEKIWAKDVLMPYTEAEMDNLAYTVGKNGKMYMLAYVKDSKRFELMVLGPDSDLEVKKIDVEGDMVFQKFDLREDEKGNLLAAGLYANGYDFKVNWIGSSSISFNTNGIYYFKLDSDGNTISKNDYAFDKEFIKLYLDDKQRSKVEKREKEGKAGIGDLRMIDFHIQEDGSVIFVAERQWALEEMYITSKQMVYHFGNVVIAKVSSDGTLSWIKKLPKNQAGLKGIGGLGIKYIEGKNAHYVLYLDNVKNANLAVNKVPEAHKDGQGGYLTAYRIDNQSGDVDKHTIVDVTDIKGVEAYQFKTSRIFDVSEGIFMLECYIKGKKDAMVRLAIKQ